MKFAGLYRAAHIAPVKREIVRVQFELHVNGLTRLDAQASEAFQFADRPGDAREEIAAVELYDLVGGDFAPVRHLCADGDGVIEPDLSRAWTTCRVWLKNLRLILR